MKFLRNNESRESDAFINNKCRILIMFRLGRFVRNLQTMGLRVPKAINSIPEACRDGKYENRHLRHIKAKLIRFEQSLSCSQSIELSISLILYTLRDYTYTHIYPSHSNMIQPRSHYTEQRDSTWIRAREFRIVHAIHSVIMNQRPKNDL